MNLRTESSSQKLPYIGTGGGPRATSCLRNSPTQVNCIQIFRRPHRVHPTKILPPQFIIGILSFLCHLPPLDIIISRPGTFRNSHSAMALCGFNVATQQLTKKDDAVLCGSYAGLMRVEAVPIRFHPNPIRFQAGSTRSQPNSTCSRNTTF
jgi:hypothetical protein